MIQRQCKMCGKMIEVPDNRRKYCDECKATRKRFMDRNALAKLREKSKDKRKQERKQLQEREARIKFLEGIIVKQQQQIQRLESTVSKLREVFDIE